MIHRIDIDPDPIVHEAEPFDEAPDHPTGATVVYVVGVLIVLAGSMIFKAMYELAEWLFGG
jgi:hypothetical protein